MATYYWVGGAGVWNSTATANWSATSNGPGGAGYPTILDDVIFDASSGTGTVTITTSFSFCRDFTVTASQALTFSGNPAGIAGNISLPAGGSTSFTAVNPTLIATSAKTITTNGKTIGQTNFNGINGTWTLQGATTFNSPTTLTAGTLNTNNQTVSSTSFISTGTLSRALNLGSSTITLTNNGVAWTVSGSNFSLNAGTSTINPTASSTFNGGGFTYNNLSFTSPATNATFVVNDNNIFNNLTVAAPPSTAINSITFGANQTVTGTFTAAGATNIRRIGIYSDVVGTQRTFNIATASCANADFRDIAVTGSVGTLTGTSLGDCGGNLGITFAAAKTVYWNLAGSQNWSSTGWATAPGGTPNSANFPLAQDTCVFDNSASTTTIEAPWNIGTLNALAKTSGSISLSTSITCNVYGDVSFGSSLSGLGGFSFSKQGIQTINFNGVFFNSSININSGTGTVRLLSNLTQPISAAYTTTLTSGTLDLNNFTISMAWIFSLSGTLPRSIAFGTGSITLPASAGITVWDGSTLTNFTLTGTPTVNLTDPATVGTRTVNHGITTGGTEANAISVNVTAGSGSAGSAFQGHFRNINLTGSSANFNNTIKIMYGNLLISAGTTVGAGSNPTTFAGTGVTQTLTTNGKTLGFPIAIAGTANTLRLLDAFTQGTSSTFTINSGTTFDSNLQSASVGNLTVFATPNIVNLVSGTLTAQTVTHNAGTLTMSASFKINVTGTYTLNAGTLDFGNQSVTFGSFNCSGSSTKIINLGSGTITITGSGSAWTANFTGTVVNPGTATIRMTSASAKTFETLTGQGCYNLVQAGAGTLTIIGSSTFNSISNSVQPTTILFPNNTFTVASLNLNGTAGNLVTIGSTIAANYTINYTGSTISTLNFVTISRATIDRAGAVFATNSTDGGNNTNITFAAADTTPRYWVSGTGTWNTASTANWAAASGGASGASVPTIETNVVFDANSNVGTGAFTVAVIGIGTSQLVCGDLTISGLDGVMTWSGTGDLSIYGSALFPPTNFTRTFSGTYTFRSTTPGKTITSSGQTITSGNRVTFDGVGGSWTLVGALNVSQAGITLVSGSFNTNGFDIAGGQFLLDGPGTFARSMNLGNSTITFVAGAFLNLVSTARNFTLNAGTSTIIASGTGSSLQNLGNVTFYNVTLASGTLGTYGINGNNSFNTLTITAPSTGVQTVEFDGTQTIANLVVTGTTPIRRVMLRSNVAGTQRTLNIASFNPADVDFRDINVTGSASPVTGTRLGNCGGNSGITFPAPKTVYWNLAGTQSFTATAWATTPAGPPSADNFPLAQDTAAFTDSGAITGVTLNTSSISYPSIDMSARTLAMTINNSTSSTIYGSWANGSGTTYSSLTFLTFSGRGSNTITSVGKTFAGNTTINCISGTYTLTDALTTGAGFTVTSGTFNSANQTITCFDINISGTATRTVNLGTSTINLTSQITPWDASTTTGLTFSGASSTINLTSTAVSTRTFQGGGLTYGTLNIGGTTGTGSVLSLVGTGTTFNNITTTKTVAHTISLATATTINFNNFNVSGSAGNLVTLTGLSSGSSLYNYIGTGVVSVDYLNVTATCVFTPAPNVFGTTPYVWYLGANSTNTTGSPIAGVAFIGGGRRAYLLTSTSAQFAWTVPWDWNSRNNKFYLIGAGGGGGNGAVGGDNRAAGGGGGGGGYTELTNISLAPNSIVSASVGTSGVNAKGSDTYVNAIYLAGGGQAGTASNTSLTSAGGAGGIGSTFNGGTGGAGAVGTVALTGYGSGGGGGAGGPTGAGGAGGVGFANLTQANTAGGGGGGNGGGSNGTAGSSALGGNGGNNFGGTGGATGGAGAGAAGTAGGGGAGGAGNFTGGQGGSGTDIENTVGGSGGRGGVGGNNNLPGPNAGLYGGGGSGAGVQSNGLTQTGGVGSQGMIFITYQPLGINLGPGITVGPGIVVT
jgi:hypothetical protein